MSVFYCRLCDFLCDSDDGAEEVAGRLVCADCMDEMEDEVEEQGLAIARTP